MLPEPFQTFTTWASEQRAQSGFVWVGIMEADPRTPNGSNVAWARDPQNRLFAMVLDGSETWWVEHTDEEWRQRFPHARQAPALNQNEENTP